MKKSDDIEAIIQQCDPEKAVKRFQTGGRCGNEGLFQFCHRLKTVAPFFDASIEHHLQRWYDRWRGSLADSNGRIPPFDEIVVMADDLWDKIKYSNGGQLAAAIVNADSRYDETIPELDGYDEKPVRRLALVCYELNSMATPEPFFLSGYDAAEILGLDRIKGQKRGYTTLGVFIRKGVICVAKKGNQKKATRYYFTGSPPVKTK